MEFSSKLEKKISNRFKKEGYIISKSENLVSLRYIKTKIVKLVKKKLNTKRNIDLNQIHKYIDVKNLNEFRLYIIEKLNSDRNIRYHYFNIAKENLYNLVGNELMMQKSLNLSIQFPHDDSSLLPIHSDVWSGDSPFEINLWLPLVNCYKTKSMYILKPKEYVFLLKKNIMKKSKNTNEIYNKVKNKINFIKISYGNFIIFNQNLPHGNIVNVENETRWSINCRFKSFFSPYGDKKIGEFFVPITTKPMTELGLNYKSPLE